MGEKASRGVGATSVVLLLLCAGVVGVPLLVWTARGDWRAAAALAMLGVALAAGVRTARRTG